MTRTRPRLTALLVLPLVASLAGCGGADPVSSTGGELGAPTPRPTLAPEPEPPATPEPTTAPPVRPAPPPPVEEPAPAPVLAVSVVVTSRPVAAYAADGTQLALVDYEEADHASAAARLTAALGLEPQVSTTGAIGTGCDADQTIYDYGGLLLRSPGYVVDFGPIEAEVRGAATSNGVAVVTVGGVRIGMTRADFDTTVGVFTDLGSYSGRNWVGFDRSNPDAAEADAIGSLARFDDGVLAQWTAPRHFSGDC